MRRFQKIDVNEPTIADTIKILAGLKSRYEEHHKIRFTSAALKTAVDLSARYINDRKLPDKAIDVIDEAAAAQNLLPPSRRKATVGTKEVEATIATMARIPPKHVSRDDKVALASLEDDLKRLVFGQDQAITALASAIKLSRAGLREPEKPVGNYLFSGPTGVGKTEVARQLAEALGIKLMRFDMSEYMERHTVSRLIGAPPGYVGFDQGGLLTDAVDQTPHAVLLLDEIEKAHPDLFNILLQVMDHGKLTDNNGKIVDFRNVILIMTTNAGAQELSKKAIGFNRDNREGADAEAIEKMFTPEFRNRLDAMIPFAPLGTEVIRLVVDKFIMQLDAQLAERNVEIELTDAARDWLAERGYDRNYGARPLARVVQEHIKKPLADMLLFGDLAGGGLALVDVKDGKIVVHGKGTPQRALPASAPRCQPPRNQQVSSLPFGMTLAFPERARLYFDGVDFRVDAALFGFKEARHGSAKSVMGDPVRRVGGDRKIAALHLVKALCAGLDSLQTTLDREFDGLIVTGLEMQAGYVNVRPPVPSITARPRQ